MRAASMFMPATPQVTALWASVPSSGFIARTIGSQAGFRASAQPVHLAASGVAGAVIGALGLRVVQIAVDLVRAAVVGQRVARLPELRADDLAHGPLRLVDHLADVGRLREPLPVEPHQAVPNLPAGVLDRAGQAVIGPRAAEGQQQGTGLAHASNGPPILGSRNLVVPVLLHEAEAVGRVRTPRSPPTPRAASAAPRGDRRSTGSGCLARRTAAWYVIGRKMR